MFKKVISVLLVCVICLTAFSPLQLKAQTLINHVAKNDVVKSDKKVAPLDLAQFFSSNVTTDSPIQLDTKKLEKERLNASRKSSLSKGQKTALYIGIPAAIAATVIIILATRNRGSGRNCVLWCEPGGCPCG